MSKLSPQDSGLDMFDDSSSLNNEQSPVQISNITDNSYEDEDDEDYEETLTERLIGLTEMFPESVRYGVWKTTTASYFGIKSFYKFTRSAMWIIFSSAAILVAPVCLEMERSQMEELSKQQQRQILLGPNAAMSSGMMGMSSNPIQPSMQH